MISNTLEGHYVVQMTARINGVEIPNALPGTVVLETGKLLGGDSAFAYNGDYQFNQQTGELEIQAVSVQFNPQGPNIFGDNVWKVKVSLCGKRNIDANTVDYWGNVVAFNNQPAPPGYTIDGVLTKIGDLPS